MNVLIADDEPTTRALLRRTLIREFGSTVTEVTNGLEAIEALTAHRYALVLLDLWMPVMNGFETLEAIRTFEPLKQVPVVVMTIERAEGNVRKLIELGISDYLTKPLVPERVVERLRRVRARIGAVEAPAKGPVGKADDDRPFVDERASFLIADGNDDFRHFFNGVFSTKRPVLLAESGVAALKTAIESRPGVIFVGSNLGPINAETLARKVKSTPTLNLTRLVAVLPKDKVEGFEDTIGFDGIVARTFVAEAFAAQVDRLIAPRGTVHHVLRAHPSLKVNLISAVEQVLGMMFGREVALISERLPRVAGDIEAQQRIEWRDSEQKLDFVIRADQASAGAMAVAMLGLELDALEEEDRSAVIGEASNIITGRLKNALDNAGSHVVCTLPEMRVLDGGRQDTAADQRLDLSFRAPEGDMTLTVSLIAVEEAVPLAS